MKYRQLCLIRTDVDPKFLSGLGKILIMRIVIICIEKDQDLPICPVYAKIWITHVRIKQSCLYISIQQSGNVSEWYVQCRHLIPALDAWAVRTYYSTARPIAPKFAGHEYMVGPKPEQSFNSLLTWVFDVLGVLFNMLSMDFATRHWQTPGRLIQELSGLVVFVVKGELTHWPKE